ncbi:hypothetical protein [Pontibacter sp. SGAir0037]|uniref:hypothetical protein n=1 Tax=Pontibacter sp. SGAir0037 TaxID=2571030 RepID=UPI0010CCDBC7|nr:hypothetical protein [Pontibacter sp. SGAir0037]QCR23430.1 hypothetical protein C1N53_14515 [Pontibacter sp. SGAir0037]
MTKKEIAYFGVGPVLILLSNFIGRIIPLFSMVTAPVIILFIVAVVNLSLFKRDFIFTSVYSFLLVILNRTLHIFLLGGVRDIEGEAWIDLSTLASWLLITMLILVYGWVLPIKNLNDAIIRSKIRRILTALFIAASSLGMILLLIYLDLKYI